MAEDRARQKRKRRKAQNVLPVNTKAKDTFFKKVCESEERLPEKVRYDIRLSESYLPVGEKYGENPPEPDLDATAHVYDFRMTLDETLRYIEQGELPDRFAAYGSDMREYALVANGITYVQRAGNDTKYVAPTNIRTVAEYLQLMLDRGIFVDLLSDKELCDMTMAQFSRDDILIYQENRAGVVIAGEHSGERNAPLYYDANMIHSSDTMGTEPRGTVAGIALWFAMVSKTIRNQC